ncbi:MAG TPA: hypothetical protein VFG33_33080 [Kribbella sp.]|uniref:hypothetical protein n=1 Tax=Kribbella sp. TaxID=1871183 RepID=UPI002D794D70|nr:hypothetical protein [Kribbella sp.]HET6298257.1 hypothetical protein [Kribbella sp.]
MRAPVLAGGVALLAALGAAAGFVGGERLDQPEVPGAFGLAAPVPVASPSAAEVLPIKTPKPSNLKAFGTEGLDFGRRSFTVQQGKDKPVAVSIRVPDGWTLTRSTKTPGEVKFLDPLKERGVRVESGFPPDLSTNEFREKLTLELESSVPHEDDLRLLAQTDTVLEDDDGQSRAVSTLIYTYIPNEVRRYVIVRWIATGDDEQATVEMSITGLPQDAEGLTAVLDEATRSVEAKAKS